MTTIDRNVLNYANLFIQQMKNFGLTATFPNHFQIFEIPCNAEEVNDEDCG